MKVSKLFAALFALLGTVLMVGGVILCFANRTAEPEMEALTGEADACAEAFLAALAAGDGQTVQSMLYGGGTLGLGPDDGSDPVWSAYYDSFSYTFPEPSSFSGTTISRNVTLTTLDIPAVTAGFSARAKDLLKARVEAEEDPSVLYGEDENFLPEVVDQVMREVLAGAFAEDVQTKERTGTLQLFKNGDRWQVIPDANLMLALSGGVN